MTHVTAAMVHAAQMALHDMLWPDKKPTEHTWVLPVGSAAIAKMIKAALRQAVPMPDTREKIRAALEAIQLRCQYSVQYQVDWHKIIGSLAAEALALLAQEEEPKEGGGPHSPHRKPAAAADKSPPAPPTPDVEAGRATPQIDWDDPGVEHGYIPALRVSAPPEEGQPEGMETLKKRLGLLSWGAQPLNIIGGQAVDKLVVDTKQCIDRLLADLAAAKAEWNELNSINKMLEAERNAALASSEADREALTRCLETQRMIEAENARLRNALEPFVTFCERRGYHDPVWSDDDYPGGGIYIGDLRRARAALAAEGGET